MLSDKPKLIFTDIAGKLTLSASLPCQQIKPKWVMANNYMFSADKK